MSFNMLHIKQIAADVALVIILQITGIALDVNIKLQLAGLAGSMLAVRTVEGKQGILGIIKTGISGLVLANYVGLFYCEWKQIRLDSFTAFFVLFLFGFTSDIFLRWFSVFGKTSMKYIPELTAAAFGRIKKFFGV